MRTPRDRRRQRLGDGSSAIGLAPGFELGEQLEDARAALGGVVELDMEVRDPLDPQARAELVPDERHRRDAAPPRSRVRSAGWPMTLTQTLRVAEVRRRLDRGDRGEPDPRIRDVPRDDRPDLLPQELIDPLGSSGSPRTRVR